MALAQIKEILGRYPGEKQVVIKLADGRRMRAVERVSSCKELYSDLYRITGNGKVR